MTEKKEKPLEEQAKELSAREPERYSYEGALIKVLIEDRGLKPEEFADLIYLDRTTVYDLFLRDDFYSKQLKRISKVLGYDFFYAPYREQNPFPSGEMQGRQKSFLVLEVEGKGVQRIELPESFRELKIKVGMSEL